MEEKRINAVKKWPKPESVRDIKVFIGFANFYWHFIKSFSRIAAPLTAILKTNRSSVTSPSRVDDNEVVGDEGVVGRSGASKKSAKSKSQAKSDNNLEKSKFLTFKVKAAFNRLKQAFTKVPIL